MVKNIKSNKSEFSLIIYSIASLSNAVQMIKLFYEQKSLVFMFLLLVFLFTAYIYIRTYFDNKKMDYYKKIGLDKTIKLLGFILVVTQFIQASGFKFIY